MHWSRNTIRISFLTAVMTCLLGMPLQSHGQQATDDSSAKKTEEPIFRKPKVNSKQTSKTLASAPAALVAKRDDIVTPPSGRLARNIPLVDIKRQPITALNIVREPHSLDRAIEMANSGLEHMRKNIRDYSAIMVKRESVNGVLSSPQYMRVKIRNERVVNGKLVPFGIYMKFLKPRDAAGREVIWVRGENNNKLIAHEAKGIASYKTLFLDPNGFIAMRGQRHPISEAGIEKMALKLIEKAERDRDAGKCNVEYIPGAKINGRACTMIKVTHPDRMHPYEFHIAKVYIDDQLNIPIRYVAYDWPATKGAEPIVMEEYTYIKVKLNIGLTAVDFDPMNPKYKYPRF